MKPNTNIPKPENPPMERFCGNRATALASPTPVCMNPWNRFATPPDSDAALTRITTRLNVISETCATSVHIEALMPPDQQ